MVRDPVAGLTQPVISGSNITPKAISMTGQSAPRGPPLPFPLTCTGFRSRLSAMVISKVSPASRLRVGINGLVTDLTNSNASRNGLLSRSNQRSISYSIALDEPYAGVTPTLFARPAPFGLLDQTARLSPRRTPVLR